MAKKKDTKFKVIEENAVDAPVKDIEWEGEEVYAESETKLTDDHGTGQRVVLRFFDFRANPLTFRQYRPTAQELFSSHRMGMEALLWRDGLVPFHEVEPRLMFSKDQSAYRFVLACIPQAGNTTLDATQTLSEIAKA